MKNKIKLSQFRNCISIDLETTGVDPEKNGIISSGVCTFFGQSLYLENYLRSDCEINEKALEVNGESEHDLFLRLENNYPSELDVLMQIFGFCRIHKTHVLVGKNPKFDYDFLYRIWNRNKERFIGGLYQVFFPLSYRVIDYAALVTPLMLMRGMVIPESGFSSSDIQNFLGLEEEPKPHNALTGAKYNVYAIKSIIEKYNDYSGSNIEDA